MNHFLIATLIHSASQPNNPLTAEDLLAALCESRPDLFNAESPIIDFHGDRYVLIHEVTSIAEGEKWANHKNFELHGIIDNREEAYQQYIGWTGLLAKSLQ